MAFLDLSPKQWGGLGLGAGSLLTGMFNQKDPEKEASNYLDQIPDTLKPYYQPFIDQGNESGNVLKKYYGDLTSNPGEFYNKIGEGYKESPGYHFKLQQALGAGNNAAAAGGMAGSPQHQQEAMETATGLADQDYGNWMDHVMSAFNTGLQGEQGFQTQGYGASTSLADMLAQALQNKGNLAYAGAQGENESNSDTFGSLAGLAAKAFGLFD